LSCTPKPLRRILRILFTIQTVNHAVLTCLIGAAVYNAIEDFENGIKDCDKAIEVNKDYVKVRKRQK